LLLDSVLSAALPSKKGTEAREKEIEDVADAKKEGTEKEEPVADTAAARPAPLGAKNQAGFIPRAERRSG
jgi:hypothetical protein